MKIADATQLSNLILTKLGFPQVVAEKITQNLIAAELVEKKTHGLIRLLAISNKVKSGELQTTNNTVSVIKEHPAALHFDAHHCPGFYAMYLSLEKALQKVKQSGIVAVSVKDIEYASGYIGDYARIATEQNMFFLGFNNSPGGLVPHGAATDLWGTNPTTIGIPTHSIPVILDMAASQTTWGDLMVAKNEGAMIKTGLAIDGEGNTTIDPAKAMEGGILPIAGHKGSGLAFIVELLAGAVTNSRVGYSVPGGWGSFYILLDPSMFRELKKFKDDVQTAIEELKAAPKATGVKEIFFPGEQSYYKRKKNLENDEITVSEKLLADLTSIFPQ